MPPKVHALTFPTTLANEFGRGDIEKYNSYAFAYCAKNYPDMQIVTRNGEQQDPHKQGCIYGIYKNGSSPGEILEKRKGKGKK